MKTLYIECKMGAAGDMLTAALYELLPEGEKVKALNVLQNIGLEGVQFSVEKVSKCGIQGTHASVTVNGIEEESDLQEHEHEHHHEVHEHEHGHEHHCEVSDHHCDENCHHDEHLHHHHHTSLTDISEIIPKLQVNEKVKKDILAVYNLIADAESHVHGVPVNEIHFHEVGNKDAIMDVAAVCYLMDVLGAGKVIASPVNAGSGTVRCAHGVLPVPAPATEYLLRGIPYYQGEIKSELCTPTGAALLKYFAEDFKSMPVMKIEKTGIGCGKKDFETANCVRIFLGEETESGNMDRVLQLDANVDDMTAEEIGFAMERLFDAGAREVFTSSVYMKKNRPGTMISVICSEDKKEEILKAFFKHTTTIGIRQKICDRYILNRDISVMNTSYGDVRKKTSSGYGSSRSKLEYDDLAEVAVKNHLSLREARALLENK